MEKYIKSPLNYTGGKFKLLPQILPLFPKDIDTFVDLFCGGGSVSMNVEALNIISNDVNTEIIELLKFLSENSEEYILECVFNIINEFSLSRSDLHGFEYYGCSSRTGRRIGIYNDKYYVQLRNSYNINKRCDYLYVLSSFSFNNQIRFNNKGEFNMPCGKQDFNKAVQRKLHIFKENKSEKDIIFTNKDFREINTNKLSPNDFVYCDPPYLVTTASYNESGGWTEKDECDLLGLLDKLNNKGIKFALSNVLTHKGKTNDILIKWCADNKDKYIVNHLDHTYSNCNYHDKTGTSGISDEVLICNYQCEK